MFCKEFDFLLSKKEFDDVVNKCNPIYISELGSLGSLSVNYFITGSNQMELSLLNWTLFVRRKAILDALLYRFPPHSVSRYA